MSRTQGEPEQGEEVNEVDVINVPDSLLSVSLDDLVSAFWNPKSCPERPGLKFLLSYFFPGVGAVKRSP